MNVEEMSTDQLEQEIQRFEVVRRQAAAVMGALIAEADRRQVPLGDGCRSTQEWVAGRIDTTPEEASGLTHCRWRCRISLRPPIVLPKES